MTPELVEGDQVVLTLADGTIRSGHVLAVTTDNERTVYVIEKWPPR